MLIARHRWTFGVLWRRIPVSRVEFARRQCGIKLAWGLLLEQVSEATMTHLFVSPVAFSAVAFCVACAPAADDHGGAAAYGDDADAVDDGSVVMASEFGDLGLGNLGAGSEVEPDRLHGGSEHLRTEAVDVDAAEDAAADTEDDWTFDGCTRSRGYWLTHPQVWSDVELTLGDRDYRQPELIVLMASPPGYDASLMLAAQLVAAELNVEAGAAYGDIEWVLDEAHALVAELDDAQPLPVGVSPHTDAGIWAVELSEQLASWNDGTCGDQY